VTFRLLDALQASVTLFPFAAVTWTFVGGFSVLRGALAASASGVIRRSAAATVKKAPLTGLRIGSPSG
jgi:hypothetical protein